MSFRSRRQALRIILRAMRDRYNSRTPRLPRAKSTGETEQGILLHEMLQRGDDDPAGHQWTSLTRAAGLQ